MLRESCLVLLLPDCSQFDSESKSQRSSRDWVEDWPTDRHSFGRVCMYEFSSRTAHVHCSRNCLLCSFLSTATLCLQIFYGYSKHVTPRYCIRCYKHAIQYVNSNQIYGSHTKFSLIHACMPSTRGGSAPLQLLPIHPRTSITNERNARLLFWEYISSNLSCATVDKFVL